MILDSLRYWVEEMHVDGFRFDLASILARDASGQALPNPPVLWDIESDPVLAGTKLIAEAWDAAGSLPGGQLRRRQLEGVERSLPRRRPRLLPRRRGARSRRIADRLVGSPEIYGHEEREAEQSVNFVTCHDGFTLNDLVSYNAQAQRGQRRGQPRRRQRQPQLELRRRGTDATIPSIERLRNRQVKNFLTVTLLSLGMPMILMGDEVRRTQRGNNNAYCQDNEISWFDWTLLEKHADVHRFVSLLIARRLLRDAEHEHRRLSLNQLLRQASKAWHGVKVGQPDWSDHSHSLAFEAELTREGLRVYLILNAYWEPLDFELPPVGDGGAGPWRRWIDTALESPQDIVPWQVAPAWPDNTYRTAAHSAVMLFAEIGRGEISQ